MNPECDAVQKLDADVEKDSQEIVDFLIRMLRIKAVNPRMGGGGELDRAEFLQSFLEGEGFSVTRTDVEDSDLGKKRPNISAKVDGKESRRLWFISHMDTVPEGSIELWNSDPFEPVVKEGKIIARGAEDNGQALVSSLFAMRALRRLEVPLPFEVGVWLVSDEEFGSTYGIKALLKQGTFRKDDIIIVPDAGSPNGRDIEIAEKGLLWLKIITKGKQVHASMPGKGLNARRVGMKLAIDLDESLARRYSKNDPLFNEPRSTFEPTKLEPNVPNANTIPGLDIAYFDCRVLPQYGLDRVMSDVKSAVRRHEKRSHAAISVEVINKESAGAATSKESEAANLLLRAVREVARTRPRLVGIGGQTVGNLFRKYGIPTAVWSTVDEVAHEPNEYSRVRNLINDTKVFGAIPLLAKSK
jgi:succinyl-diaminopimelate desuccinylase